MNTYIYVYWNYDPRTFIDHKISERKLHNIIIILDGAGWDTNLNSKLTVLCRHDLYNSLKLEMERVMFKVVWADISYIHCISVDLLCFNMYACIYC